MYLTNGFQDLLNFTWNSSFFSIIPLSSIRYVIAASHCGICPKTSNYTTVTCTDVPTDGGMCTLTIQTFVCGCFVGSKDYWLLLEKVESNPNLVLLPVLTSSLTLFIAMIILVGIALFTVLLYKQLCRTSKGNSG